MVTIRTKSGENFDSICYKQYGSSKYLPDLMSANPQHLETFIFPAGIELTVPEIEVEKAKTNLPSWYSS